MNKPTDLLEQANAELAGLDEQIATLQQRRDQLRTFVSLGAALYATPGKAPVPAERAPTPAAAVVQAVSEIVQSQGPTATRTLLEQLIQRGMHIRGPNQASNLSVMLSKSEKFKSSRTEGWSLRPVEPS